MNLYNILHGESSISDKLLSILGFTYNDIPRYRDCFLQNDERTDQKVIVIHTRTGGGNRDYYEDEESCRSCYPEYFDDENDKPTGPWNDDIRANPHFLYDSDDDYDCTYANFYFKIPETVLKELEQFDNAMLPSEKWEKLFEAMSKRTNHATK